MNKFSVLFELRCMLHEMEEAIGLKDLTAAEVDVLLAAHTVTGKFGKVVTSDQIRRQEFASDLSQASYHRALRSLVGLGFLEKAKGYKSRHYIVRGAVIGE